MLSLAPGCDSVRMNVSFSSLFLGPTWNESSQRLVLFVSVPISLPPVGIILADNVQDVSLLKTQPQLSTWQKRVVGGIVVEVSSHVHLRTDGDEESKVVLPADMHPQACKPHHPEGLTTVCLCGAGLICELGIKRKVRVPCICCWWTNRKQKKTDTVLDYKRKTIVEHGKSINAVRLCVEKIRTVSSFCWKCCVRADQNMPTNQMKHIVSTYQ